VSQQIHAIFARYTPTIQPLSLDEAYLDVTTPLLDRGSATAIAAEIRAAIRQETGLTASAGVSYNKFLAKLASDHRKPDGLFVITPRMGPAFVAALPVGKFHGIGPVTAGRMQALGIHTGLDLRQRSRAVLTEHFGKSGDYLYGVARGVDDRPVQADRVRKSVGAETTFERDLLGWDEVAPALASGVRQGLGRLQRRWARWAHRDGEAEVCRLPADHPQPVAGRADRHAAHAGADQPRPAAAVVSAAARGASARGHAVEPGGRGVHRPGPAGAWARVAGLLNTRSQFPPSDDAQRRAMLSHRLFSHQYK